MQNPCQFQNVCDRIEIRVYRAYAILVTLLVCGAVLSPIVEGFKASPHDDFPLSWYPMFARPRPKWETPVYVVGVDAMGNRQKLSQQWWTAGGFNQGATQLIQAAQAGKEKLAPLCERIASKVARKKLPELAGVVEVVILRGRYSLESWFGEGNRKPEREDELQRCAVVRP